MTVQYRLIVAAASECDMIETVDSGSGEVVESLFNYCPHCVDAIATRITSSDIHVYLHDGRLALSA
ncbi:hypothetical protein Pan181_36100 [Aeoliella mucimassa]|uniref:Uncharacterized protein n=1 Tax=Aeoliella mucimassa TaxID=2527972 RepID=A0A518ARQ0_9BACT|nr:hypothetical protein Pan181_36100 [Aeoliella mucimassa]